MLFPLHTPSLIDLHILIADEMQNTMDDITKNFPLGISIFHCSFWADEGFPEKMEPYVLLFRGVHRKGDAICRGRIVEELFMQ